MTCLWNHIVKALKSSKSPEHCFCGEAFTYDPNATIDMEGKLEARWAKMNGIETKPVEQR